MSEHATLLERLENVCQGAEEDRLPIQLDAWQLRWLLDNRRDMEKQRDAARELVRQAMTPMWMFSNVCDCLDSNNAKTGAVHARKWRGSAYTLLAKDGAA